MDAYLSKEQLGVHTSLAEGFKQTLKAVDVSIMETILK
jgi:hypothetical protein